MAMSLKHRWPKACVALSVISVAALSACGGGGGGSLPATPPATSCDVDTQKDWLRNYMQESYFWTGLAPNPAPTGYATLASYYDALLYTGSGSVPKDRWSYISDSAAYNQFFEEGKTLGYGIAVNGLEGKLPLKIRYVEPKSPAAALGLARGDVIKSLNGISDADLFATGKFDALTPGKEGDTVTIQLEGSSGLRTVSVSAATYTLQPVTGSSVLTLSNGSKVGYVSLKDFITQAESPLNAAISDFQVANAKDVIVDLRYNGGGRVSTATVLASLVAGRNHADKVFTRLIFSSKQSGFNSNYTISSVTRGFTRAVILTGPRTCSASELLANGLKPFMQVVTIGAQTCGKPFGFNPVDSCGKTISAVNFESVNANGEGRYYDGIAPTCSATDDFSRPLGDLKESLTSVAASYLVSGTCPASAVRVQALSADTISRRAIVEPGEFRGMRAD